jgi:hypothetical protein
MALLSPKKNPTPSRAGAKPLVSLIVPTRNEERNLPQLFASIPDMVDEVVLVDGRSSDNTVALARQLRPDILVVHQTGKGKGNALIEGFLAANGDIIVMIDADGSTNPAEIPNFVGALLAGADFAKGSRFMQGAGTSDMEFHRYLGNQFFVWSVRFFFGGKYTDLCYGYNAFWTRTLPLLSLDGSGFEIETMMNVRALQAGLQVAEVPSFENRRFMGFSNLHAVKDGLRVLRTIFQEWLKAPSLRAVKRQESSVAEQTFKKAFHTLLEDATQFVKMCPQLSPEQAQMAGEKLMQRFEELMRADLDCAGCRQLQRRYDAYYKPIFTAYLRQFMPHDVKPVGDGVG